MAELTERRRARRAEIALECTLRRRAGAPIAARTLDLSTGGMRVASPRPLALDEWLEFELSDPGVRVGGHASVLREEHLNVYGLRFERLPAAMVDGLRDILAAAPRP